MIYYNQCLQSDKPPFIPLESVLKNRLRDDNTTSQPSMYRALLPSIISYAANIWEFGSYPPKMFKCTYSTLSKLPEFSLPAKKKKTAGA